MPAIALAVTARRAAAVAALLVMATATTAYANETHGVSKAGGNDHHQSGGNDNGTLSATAGGNTVGNVHLTYPTGGSGDKSLGSVDVSWTPPPCWLGPESAAEFKSQYTKEFNKELPDVHGTFRDAMGMDMAHFKDGYDYPGEKGYKDFNMAQADKGMWWVVFTNPAADPVAQMSCNDQRPVWVLNGKTPPAGTGHVITVETLYKLAYAHTHVPGVTIEMNPANRQTVNVPTWVWLKEQYTTVKVRASVDLGGGAELWAETTATPASVHIEPGTRDATVFPSSGDCPIGKDGSVGTKYNGNPQADPPCGVTYLHSTQNRSPFQMDVIATWNVRWTGSGGAGGTLPNGTVDNPQGVTVREIQTVNR